VHNARFQDDPWQRLPWLVPGALIGASIALMVFMRLLMQVPIGPAPPTPVDVQVVELPAPAAAAPTPPSPSQPVEAAAPPEPPQPPPIVKEEPPPPVAEGEPPPPEAKPEVRPQPVIVPPPKRQPPPHRAAPPKPAAAAPAQPAAPPEARPDPQPIARAPAAAAALGGNLGARAIYKPMPEIPEELRRRNVEWVAVARFRVGADGSAQVEMVEATSEPALNRLLLESLKKWRFFPAMENGKPTASTIDIRIPIEVR
jgi:periplasmic protein TonB